MRLKSFWIISGILILSFSLAGVLAISPKRRAVSQDREVASAIDDLWSADDQARQAAKEKLIQLGQASVEPLIHLLHDIVTNPTPRYLHGKEEKVSEIEERLQSLPKEKQREEAELLLELGGLGVNWRLKSDICELLGRLRAEAAIPVLIEMMETEDSASTGERRNIAMNALVEIGPASLPKIIESIETAESRAAAIVFGDGHRPSDFFIRTETFKVQARAAMVLGDIGDPRALPVLEEILNKTRNEELIPYIKEAIEKIRKSK